MDEAAIISAHQQHHLEEDHPQGQQLRTAASTGHTARVVELLDQGVLVDAKDQYKVTALMCASGNGHAEVVKLLLSRQADVDALNSNGESALLYAVSELEIVKLLEAAGADIHLKAADGCTALIHAAYYDHLPVCLFLLSKGADLMAAYGNNNHNALCLYGKFVDTPLTSDALAERRAALKAACLNPALVDDDDDDDEEDDEDDWSNDEDDEDEEENWSDDEEWPGVELREAAGGGEIELVRELLDQGADVDVRDSDGWTALMLACEYGHAEVAKLLLSRNAEVDAKNNHSETAIMFASQKGSVGIVELLVTAGADIHRIGMFGCSALRGAAQWDNLPVCLLLLSKGADLMAESFEGGTALTMYGALVNSDLGEHIALSPATLAERRDALEKAWRAGPHPSQVQRRKDEAWDRRKSIMQVSAENGYRPLAHRIAAMPPVDPAAAIVQPLVRTRGQRRAHLLGQVLSNEGIHRNIVSML